MTHDSNEHTGDHVTHHHASQKQSSRFLLLAVPFLLILILLTVAVSLGNNQGEQQGELYPQEPTEEEMMEQDELDSADEEIIEEEPEVMIQEEVVEEPTEEVMEEPEIFVGEPASQADPEVTIVSNPADPQWIAYKPLNLRSQLNAAQRTATVSWTDPTTGVKPYGWLLGYTQARVGALANYNPENIDKMKWSFINNTHPQFNSPNKSLILDFKKFSVKRDLFYFLYVRTQQANGQYVDYVYGANGSVNTPFVQRAQ